MAITIKREPIDATGLEWLRVAVYKAFGAKGWTGERLSYFEVSGELIYKANGTIDGRKFVVKWNVELDHLGPYYAEEFQPYGEGTGKLVENLVSRLCLSHGRYWP